MLVRLERFGRASFCAALLLVLSGIACAGGQGSIEQGRPEPAVKITADTDAAALGRALMAGQWLGIGISYSGYREGQSPDSGVHPTPGQIEEDLRIIEKNWRLIRLYSSNVYSENILKLIREKRFAIRVMLGAWLAREPGHEEVNKRQLDECIRLAKEYRDIVFAVNVGNEVLVEWTAHPVREETMVEYVRYVKARVDVPVTIADNYAWWRDDGQILAEELDFLTVHTYPVWERKGIDEGLSFTIENIESVREALPGMVIVIGEAGWPSYTEGNLHVPRAGNEENQKRYYQELTNWAAKNDITTFVFEAFDEPWKGTGTEGHWGLFSVDRKAKLVMHEAYPELVSNEPTSPDYSNAVEANYGVSFADMVRGSFADKIKYGTVNPLGPAIPVQRVGRSENAVDGDASLRFHHIADVWGGMYFMFATFDASEYENLVIAANIPADVASLELKLEGPSTVGHVVNMMDYASGDGPKPGWRTFVVPLAAFDGVDVSRLEILGFWNPRDGNDEPIDCEILLDDLRFE